VLPNNNGDDSNMICAFGTLQCLGEHLRLARFSSFSSCPRPLKLAENDRNGRCKTIYTIDANKMAQSILTDKTNEQELKFLPRAPSLIQFNSNSIIFCYLSPKFQRPIMTPSFRHLENLPNTEEIDFWQSLMPCEEHNGQSKTDRDAQLLL
jgi:hypothetical protein